MKAELNILPHSQWLGTGKQPLVISGPCSAETEEQLMATARAIAAGGKVSYLRAGIWKPRTRPGEFEGIGSAGLEWLRNAGHETGLPTATEVANAAHVEQALRSGVSLLWIGARSTVNPFTVQEIADALKGVDIPVLVKNPLNPELSLWIGALERINKAGINKLGAIHRGFSSFEKTSFRNQPMWDLAISLKEILPDIAILNDPSHICGNRDLIPYIAQKALDLDMQGLMIEAHINPEQAWTDAKQQLTPDALNELIGNLKVRTPGDATIIKDDALNKYRRQIDEIDADLLRKLSERMQVVKMIGDYKKANDMTILQISRWDEVLQKALDYSAALKLHGAFAEKVLRAIHNESIRVQTGIMNGETNPEG